MSEQAIQDTHSAGSFGGNVWLLIMDAQSKSIKTTDEKLFLDYTKQSVISDGYKTHLEEWKESAALLPEAGKKGETAASYNINSKGMATMAISGVCSALLIVGAVLGYFGVATVGFAGAGLIFMAAAAAVIGIAYAIMQGRDNNGNTDYVPSHMEYDTGKQGEANSNVQRMQSLVQQDQNDMNRIMSQDINPSFETKSQASNMFQGSIQSFKNMVWSV